MRSSCFTTSPELRRLEKSTQRLRRQRVARLRTPLDLDQGLWEALLDGGEDDPLQRRPSSEIIMQQSNRLNLDYWMTCCSCLQIESGTGLVPPESLNCVPAGTHSGRDQTAGRQKQHTIELTPFDDYMVVEGDEGAWWWVFINLLENAVEVQPGSRPVS